MERFLIFTVFAILTVTSLGIPDGGLPRVADLFDFLLLQRPQRPPPPPPDQLMKLLLKASAAQQREMSSTQQVMQGLLDRNTLIDLLLDRAGVVNARMRRIFKQQLSNP